MTPGYLLSRCYFTQQCHPSLDRLYLHVCHSHLPQYMYLLSGSVYRISLRTVVFSLVCISSFSKRNQELFCYVTHCRDPWTANRSNNKILGCNSDSELISHSCTAADYFFPPLLDDCESLLMCRSVRRM